MMHIIIVLLLWLIATIIIHVTRESLRVDIFGVRIRGIGVRA